VIVGIDGERGFSRLNVGWWRRSRWRDGEEEDKDFFCVFFSL